MQIESNLELQRNNSPKRLDLSNNQDNNTLSPGNNKSVHSAIPEIEMETI